MRNLLAFFCAGAVALGLTSSAGATPVDFTDTTDRDAIFSILLDDAGIFAQDAGANLILIPAGGTLTFDVPADSVVFTIPAVDWTDSLIAVFGESTDPASCGAPNPACTTEGVIPDTVTDFNTHFVLSTGASDQAFPTNWQAVVVFDLGAPLGLLPVLLTARDTDPVLAAAGDWFWMDPGPPPSTLALSCVEANPANIPVGACDPLDFRLSQTYDPTEGEFTFLAVIDNGVVDPTFTPQGGALCETLANGGDDSDCDGVPDAVDPCLTFHNDDVSLDSNGDGVPNDCQCGDTNMDGFVASTDAFNMVNCLVDPLCAAGPPDVTIWDTNNDGFVVSTDAFNAVNAAFVTMTPYTLTCSRRPEGTNPLP